MNPRWLLLALLLGCLGCASSKKPAHHRNMQGMDMQGMNMMMPSGDKPLQMQLAAKKYLQEHVPAAWGKKVLFIVDRSMNADALDAYLSAAAALGIYSTSIIVEARRDIDTPARLIAAYQDDWLPKWIVGAAPSFDQVFLGTYWNYQEFLPASETGKWQQLPYITSDQLLSPAAHFPQAVREALESSFAGALQKSAPAGMEILDPEGTELKLQGFAVAGTEIPNPAQASGQIGLSIYDGLNSPLQIKIQKGRITAIAGGGQLGDFLRSMAAKNPLSLLEISFGLNPQAALPKNFANLTWTAWVSAWSAMSERSGTVRYEIGAPGKRGLAWEFANFYPTVIAQNEPLIRAGHLLALDSPAIAAALTEQDKKAQLLKESWSPYPEVELPDRQKAGGKPAGSRPGGT